MSDYYARHQRPSCGLGNHPHRNMNGTCHPCGVDIDREEERALKALVDKGLAVRVDSTPKQPMGSADG